MTLTVLFWILFFILIYTFIGYALILLLLYQLKRIFFAKKQAQSDTAFEPDVCLFVTAFNEKDYVRQKVENLFSLDYPREKVQYVWVTDGSDDGTPELLAEYETLEIYHQPERRGKMNAMNRGMKYVKAPIVIFSDSNTILSRQTIREMVARFSDPGVGCVAGEKRIVEKKADAAAAAGEGLYWKYESWVKKMDASLNSAVGAVGELFAIRTELFQDVEPDTILDDFIISLRIAQKGFKIAYTPNAWAEETASLNVAEELKRKIRIAAGGMQTIFRLKSLLNPFRYGLLSWQYVSHKVLRWTLAPLSLFAIFIVNLLIVMVQQSWMGFDFFSVFLYIQVVAYLLAFTGWILENNRLRFKLLFVPYYFVSMNYASICGMLRYLKGKQSVNWEKSKRA